jgi:hypothetical protein
VFYFYKYIAYPYALAHIVPKHTVLSDPYWFHNW